MNTTDETPTEKSALLEAVNALIASPYAHEWFDAMNAVVPAAMRAPVKLTDGPQVLNPLLRLRIKSPDAYQRVLGLIEAKREKRGLEPLVKPAEQGYNKTTYMREFMDAKRERQRKAAEIENLLRPDRDRLVGNTRLEFMNRQAARWKEERDTALEVARHNAGGHLSADMRKAALDEFWSNVDRDLDSRLEAAKRARLSPQKMTGGTLIELNKALTSPNEGLLREYWGKDDDEGVWRVALIGHP